MDSTIIAAIIGAIAMLIVAVIKVWTSHSHEKKQKQKTKNQLYQDLSDAFRIGCGVSGLVFASTINSQPFEMTIKNMERNTFLRLATRLIPPKSFPSVDLLMQKVLASGDFQTANALHEEITNIIFDNHPPAVQVAYVSGVYIPILEFLDPNSKQDDTILTIILKAITPLRGTVYKASDVYPNDFRGWYEDILAKRNIAKAASKIVKWFDSLK